MTIELLTGEITTVPAGVVGYFDAPAAGIAEGLDDVGLDAIAERYQMEVVGPVPEGYL